MSSGKSCFPVKIHLRLWVFLIAVPTLFLPIPVRKAFPTYTHVQLETECCLTCIFGASSDLCFFVESIILLRLRTESFCDFNFWFTYYCYLTKDGHIFGILKDLELLTVMFHVHIEPTWKETLLAQIPLTVLNILQPGGISRSMVNRLKAFYYPPLVCP